MKKSIVAFAVAGTIIASMFGTKSFVVDAHNSASNNVSTSTYSQQKGFWVMDDKGWRYDTGYGYYKNDKKLIEDKYYYFDSDGYMKTGWIYDSSWCVWLYAGDNGELYTNCWANIGGKSYYFDDDGHMLVNHVTPDGYYVDPSGVWDNTPGWKYYEIDIWNHIYLYCYVGQDGKAYTDGWKIIDGVYYYFDESGWCGCGGTTPDGYYVNKSGAWDNTPGWKIGYGYQLTDCYYYVGIDGKAYTDGWYKIDGQQYYFDEFGDMCSASVTPDGYYVNESGAWDNTTGWKYVYNMSYGRNVYFYVKPNGQAAYNEWCLVGNDYYYFEDGIMLDACVIDDKYYVDSSGRWISEKGWHYVSMWNHSYEYIYVKDSGVLCCREWATIDGQQYYFDRYCTMASERFVDGYYVDASGKYLAPGWNKINGYWKYYERVIVNDEYGSCAEGYWYYGGDYDIGGNEYVFDEQGNMLTGWLDMYGRWKYYDESGALVRNSWKKIGGTWYCFDEWGFMYADEITPDGYYVDANGAWNGKDSANDQNYYDSTTNNNVETYSEDTKGVDELNSEDVVEETVEEVSDDISSDKVVETLPEELLSEEPLQGESLTEETVVVQESAVEEVVE